MDIQTYQCHLHDDNGLNLTFLSENQVRVYGESERLINSEDNNTFEVAENGSSGKIPVALLCEQCFNRDLPVYLEAQKTAVHGELLRYRVQLPGRERKWVILKDEQETTNDQLSYTTVGFLTTDGSASKTLRFILVENAATMARLQLAPEDSLDNLSAGVEHHHTTPRKIRPKRAVRGSPRYQESDSGSEPIWDSSTPRANNHLRRTSKLSANLVTRARKRNRRIRDDPEADEDVMEHPVETVLENEQGLSESSPVDDFDQEMMRLNQQSIKRKVQEAKLDALNGDAKRKNLALKQQILAKRRESEVAEAARLAAKQKELEDNEAEAARLMELLKE